MEWEDSDLSNEEKIHEAADLSKVWKNHIGNRKKKWMNYEYEKWIKEDKYEVIHIHIYECLQKECSNGIFFCMF